MPRLLSRLLSGTVALVLFVCTPAFAQSPPAEGYAEPQDVPPAHISYADGTVLVEHDASAENAEPNTPLAPGDRVRTEAGRAEILFGDGSLVHLDEHTTLDLLSDRLVRLIAGRLVVVAGTGLAGQLQVDAAAASVRVLTAGEYRIASLARGTGSDLELAVTRGSAELIGDDGSMVLRAGQRALAALGAALQGPWPFNSAQFDRFDAWSQARLDARRGPASYQYLPPEVQSYAGDFDAYGSWSYMPTYGYVWYPRVDFGWRPYYHGRWKHYRRFGWTWIGGPRWSWPTHHYGRWGLSGGGTWFWIPGRRWSSAWVYWGIAPGYVSWCPLGFDDRPVLGFWSYRTRHSNPWRAWTVVHRGRFGDRRWVRAYALDGSRVLSSPGTTFVTQAAPPAVRGTRSGRLQAGIAVPRAGTGRRAGDPAAREVPHRSGRVTGFGTGAGHAGAVPQPDVRRPDGSPGQRTGAPTAYTRSPRTVPSPSPQPGGSIDSPPGRTGYAVPRGSRRAPRWSPEDVPVYRGGVRNGEPPQEDAPSTSGQTESPADEATPTSRRTPYGGSPGYVAVPRGGDRPSAGPAPSESEGARRGSFGVPAPQRSAPSAPPPQVHDSGGRERRAPDAAGSGGRAVPRGSSAGSGGGRSDGGGGRAGGESGGRVGGARRR